MAEYIEREATIKLLRSLGNRDYRREKGTIQEAIKMVSYPEYTPTIDAVPVVRCRECKYRFKNNGHSKDGCPIIDANIWMDDDDFCSHGERKEGADNG